MAKPKQVVKKFDINVMERITKHTKTVGELLKEHLSKTQAQQVKHTREKLRTEVWAACGFIAEAMRQGKLQSDPTGFITATADYDEPVNTICKEWLAAYSKANPNPVMDEAAKLMMQDAHGGGLMAKIVFYTKTGIQFIWNGIKKTVEFIWNGVKRIYNWAKDIIVSFWDWFCDKLNIFQSDAHKERVAHRSQVKQQAAVEKARVDEAKDTETPVIDVNQILKEGAESLEENKSNSNAGNSKINNEVKEAIPA